MRRNTYDPQTAKFLAKVSENMPELTGEQMQAWIQNPRVLQKALAMLGRPLIEGIRPDPFIVWKEIVVGGMTNEQLAAELDSLNNGRYIDSHMLRHCPEILTQHKAHLAIVSDSELGFTGHPTLRAVLKRAREVGLWYHAAVGPYLRLAYLEQEEDKDRLVVAHEPLPYNDAGVLTNWYLDNYEGVLTLMDNGANEGWDWSPGELVYVVGGLEPL